MSDLDRKKRVGEKTIKSERIARCHGRDVTQWQAGAPGRLNCVQCRYNHASPVLPCLNDPV